MLGDRACEPIHEQSLALDDQSYRVYRCSWGWCVKHRDRAFRSRLLLDAFEQALGNRASEAAVRTVVDAMGRALEAEYAATSATASAVLSVPPTP
jgi:hypothetical protein